MQFWAQQWRESCLRHLFFLLRHTFLPYLASLFFSSFLWKGYCFFDSRVLQSRWVQYLLNPAYLTNAWYESAFYRRGTRQLRHLSLITPAAGGVRFIRVCFSALCLLSRRGFGTIFA